MLLIIAAGCGKNDSEPAFNTWSRFTSEAGKYSVLLPGTPIEKEQAVQSPNGPMTAHMIAVNTGAHDGYGVSYYDLPIKPDAEKYLDNCQAQIVGDQGKLISQKDITVGDNMGREFELVKSVEGANYSFVVKMVLAGQRMYILTGVFPAANPHPANCDSFFDSLSLQ